MHWENIHGWFTYQELYNEMVASFDNAVFVEVGTWMGKSIVYLAEKIKESGKNIELYGVDKFVVTNDCAGDSFVENKDFFMEYLDNIQPVTDHIITIIEDSVEAAKDFEDESVDFVFIDADHTYEGCLRDITAWYPKVKYGGVIAGHDYRNDSTCQVKQAVNEYFKGKARAYTGGCWIYNKD